MEESSSISLPPERRFRYGNTFLRACLVANSVILWVGGVFFFLLGVFAYNFLKRFFPDGQGLKYAAGFPIASITLGILTILISLLSDYFLIFPSKMRYYTISGVLALIFMFEFVYFIAGVDYGRRVETVVNKGFKTAMINYKDGFVFNMELNLVQWLLKCCGAKSYKDWFETTWAEGRIEVPESCCIDVNWCHNLEPVMIDDIHQKGCEEKLSGFIRTHNVVLITLIVLTMITQFIGVILTAILGIREDNKVKPRRRTTSAGLSLLNK